MDKRPGVLAGLFLANLLCDHYMMGINLTINETRKIGATKMLGYTQLYILIVQEYIICPLLLLVQNLSNLDRNLFYEEIYFTVNL